MDEITGPLNDAQRQAVTTTEGPVLIVAGPGSGKTRVITHRVAHLIRNLKVQPSGILGVTFANRATREMQRRVEQLCGGQGTKPQIRTFHSFGARFLRTDGDHVGLDRHYSIYDEQDREACLKAVIANMGLKNSVHISDATGFISNAKNNLRKPEEAKARAGSNSILSLLADVYEQYEANMRRSNGADFDDLIMKPVQVLHECPEVLRRYQGRFTYLMVDEFQDTNLGQYELTRLLSMKSRNVCVVGDPDQSIYGWRGADHTHMYQFLEDYPEAKTVALGQNYRSTRNLVSATRGLIENNPRLIENPLYTNNNPGYPVESLHHDNENAEADFIVDEILRLTREEHVPIQACAVLYRANAISGPIEEVMVRRNMKYRLFGGVAFYSRKEVKNLIGYLHVIHNPWDNVNLSRVINCPPRGIGPKTLQTLNKTAQDNVTSLMGAAGLMAEGYQFPYIKSGAQDAIVGFADLMRSFKEASHELTIAQLMDLIIEKTDMYNYLHTNDEKAKERVENLSVLRNSAAAATAEPAAQALEEYLESINLMTSIDTTEGEEEVVTLSTLHQSKGLEFDSVFMVGMEEGTLPGSQSLDKKNGVEEERRVCYVGATRAMRRLYLSRSRRSRTYRAHERKQRATDTDPSRFTDELLDGELDMEKISIEEHSIEEQPADPQEQTGQLTLHIQPAL